MGEVSRDEFRQLRNELRETREIASAVLLAIVGKEKATTWRIDAAVQRRFDKEVAGPPLREVVGHSVAERIWREFDVAGVRGLRCLDRDAVAALPGIGPVTIDKLDVALADQGVAWGDWPL